MKFINTDHQAGNDHWELRDGDNQPVEIGRIVASSRRHLNPEEEQRSFQLEGGTCPQRPSSSGKVHGFWVEDRASGNPVSNGEYYPQVFGLEWHQVSKPETEPETEPESPSGQLIGVIITSMINDGIKAAMGGLIKIEIDKLRDELVTAIENLENTLEDQASEYLIADEHDYVESHDLEDAINSELDSRSWDIDDHSSEIQDLMTTSLQSEVQTIVQDMVRERAFVVSLNPE